MIEIKNLEFAYPRSGFRLAIPSMQVAAGEKVAVIGASGTGKTTLLNLVAGIALPQAGSIRLDDQPVHSLNDRQRRALRLGRIGMVFQDFALIDYLSVLDNILLSCRIGASPRPAAMAARALQLAASTGLADKLKRRPKALSQGEKQRAAICRALLLEPKVLLADEATGNLDPANKQAVLDLLFTQADAHGSALLAVTHDHELLDRFDRTIDFRQFTG